jgi:hypothetical protein
MKSEPFYAGPALQTRMGALQLFQEEELFLRFRPHIFSFVPHYAASFGWLVAAAVGAFVGILSESAGMQHPSVWGLFGFAVVGLAGGFLRSKMKRGSMAFSWFGASIAVGVALLIVFLDLPDVQPWLPTLGLGALVSLVRLVGWELVRMQRLHFLTSQRLVVRAGLGHRQEESLPLSKIQDVRSQLGLMGQLFDYGDLILGLGFVGRGKGAKEDTWVLAGIGRLRDVKHQLEQLLEEQRLPTRERRKRVEERRLRESMRRLASWMRRDRSQHLSL